MKESLNAQNEKSLLKFIIFPKNVPSALINFVKRPLLFFHVVMFFVKCVPTKFWNVGYVERLLMNPNFILKPKSMNKFNMKVELLINYSNRFKQKEINFNVKDHVIINGKPNQTFHKKIIKI